MKKVLVTGANGFIGRNLCLSLSQLKGIQILKYDVNNTEDELDTLIGQAEFIFNLAGVNRPQDESEYKIVNSDLTRKIINLASKTGRKIPILFSSSVQAILQNPYGKSKCAAEGQIFAYGQKNDVPVYVFRLANVFGKWARPNYNSVVATWCYNIIRGLEVHVRDSAADMSLVYIDDVVDAFIATLEGKRKIDASGFCLIEPVYTKTLGEIIESLFSFHQTRGTLSVPDQSCPFAKKLYATYLSYLPDNGFSYPLKMNIDVRGSFTEFIRTEDRGQFSINVSKPHIVKGQHWHHTKHEKFLVVNGMGIIRLRKMECACTTENKGQHEEVLEYRVSGKKLEVVEIPPGYTHNIENIGDVDMVTVMWANESFNPQKPDTYAEPI